MRAKADVTKCEHNSDSSLYALQNDILIIFKLFILYFIQTKLPLKYPEYRRNKTVNSNRNNQKNVHNFTASGLIFNLTVCRKLTNSKMSCIKK